jgi:ankyrin repeat protein
MADTDLVTQLFQAAAKNDVAAIHHLVGSGVNPNSVSHYGSTPLHNACMSGSLDAVRALVALGADPNLKYTYKSPVDGRVEADRVAIMATPSAEIAQFLMDNGSNPNAIDGGGNSVLMLAAQRNRPELVRVLISAGARADMRNAKGYTAMDFASNTMQFYKECMKGGVNPAAEKRVKELHEVLSLLKEQDTTG